jgi:hypothetical protein
VDAEGTQSFGDEAHWAECSQSKPKIPIRRKPESLIQSTGTNGSVSPEHGRWYRNEVLNEKALYESTGRHIAFRKRAGPRSEFLSIRTYEHGIMKNKRAFGTLHLGPKPRHPARKPKVILMKKAGPIARSFTQTDIADGHPVSDSAGSKQPDRKSFSEVTHNIQSAI